MPAYKYCIVPKCINTTAVTPNKLFFRVPRNKDRRTKWCKAMKRNDKTPLSEKSGLYCCEDHFDVEEDMANYSKFKLMGGQLKLKKGVVPHKLDCQKNEKVIVLEKLSAFTKRKQIESFERVLKKNICPENVSEVPIEFIKCEPAISKDDTETDPLGDDYLSSNESSGPSSSYKSMKSE